MTNDQLKYPHEDDPDIFRVMIPLTSLGGVSKNSTDNWKVNFGRYCVLQISSLLN